ncbi:MAG TPA: D-alanyl-D-alanine carboxypeptidase [Candidatus Woesebacteria bacterium]|nr:D-alanyl-D-alanine carboxypeptidase [Candidatus Woesebacteria bacterium]
MKNKTVFIGLVIADCFFVFFLAAYLIHYPPIRVKADSKIPIDYQETGRPVVINKDHFPILDSPSYILVDAETNTVLAQKNSLIRVFPASTTKLVTALTALNIYPLEEIVTISRVYPEGKTMGLVPGEKMTVLSLVQALLVSSANDAAYNLADHHLNGTAGFVTDMNRLVVRYGLKNTHFVNFDGIHHPNHYSTAFDLAQLARLAIKNPIITEVASQKEITVTDVDRFHQYHLTTTNELLGVIPEIKGLKTGWTPEAGGCFISLIDLNGHQLIGVVTQSQDRFKDTKKLIDWAKNSVIW